MRETLFLLPLFFVLCAKAQETTEEFSARHNKALQEWVGKPFPNFSFPGSSGRIYSQQNLIGKITLVDFWELSCSPCMYSIKYFNAIHDSMSHAGFQFLSITINDWDECIGFRNKRGFHLDYSMPTYEIISMGSAATTPDNQKAITNLSKLGVPLFLIVDSSGIIRAAKMGFAIGKDVHAERPAKSPWQNDTIRFLMEALQKASKH